MRCSMLPLLPMVALGLSGCPFFCSDCVDCSGNKHELAASECGGGGALDASAVGMFGAPSPQALGGGRFDLASGGEFLVREAGRCSEVVTAGSRGHYCTNAFGVVPVSLHPCGGSVCGAGRLCDGTGTEVVVSRENDQIATA